LNSNSIFSEHNFPQTSLEKSRSTHMW